jgi:nicotinamidase-related amidase
MIEKNSVLIVIDSQNQFVEDMPDEMDAWSIVDRVADVIAVFREKKLPVIHFREIHRKQQVDFGRELDGNESIHCIEGTRAADYTDKTRPEEGEYVIDKRRYSAFFGTDLNILLRGLKAETLYIVGFLTDVCVHYTCADAHQYDYHIRVVKEATGGSCREATEASLRAIHYLQNDSIVSIADLTR